MKSGQKGPKSGLYREHSDPHGMGTTMSLTVESVMTRVCPRHSTLSCPWSDDFYLSFSHCFKLSLTKLWTWKLQGTSIDSWITSIWLYMREIWPKYYQHVNWLCYWASRDMTGILTLISSIFIKTQNVKVVEDLFCFSWILESPHLDFI